MLQMGNYRRTLCMSSLKACSLWKQNLCLSSFIYEEGYFDLETLNGRMSYFAYGRIEARNKPPKVFEHTPLTGTSKLPLRCV